MVLSSRLPTGSLRVTWQELPADFVLPDDPVENLQQPALAAALTDALGQAGRIPPEALTGTNFALGLVVGLSLWPGIQQRLLAGRLLAQTIYHQLTLQLPQDEPPVTLVAVDSESIRRSPLLSTPNPIDRRYLASLVAALGQQGATVIGIDYLSELRHVREGRTP